MSNMTETDFEAAEAPQESFGGEGSQDFEAATSEPENQSDALSAEEIARERGWRSRDEWRGPVPPNFVDDPEEFNKSWEATNPLLKKEIETLRSDIESMRQYQERMKQGYERQLEQERKRIEQDLDLAVKRGDTKAHRELLQERDKLYQSQPEQSADNDPHFVSWLAENDWYNPSSPRFDGRMKAYADSIAETVARETGLTPQGAGRRFYDEVAKRVRSDFSPATPAQPRVEQPRKAASMKAKPWTKWDDLPAALKADRENVRIMKKLYRGDGDAFARDLWIQKQES